jgi:hypothetical protein
VDDRLFNRTKEEGFCVKFQSTNKKCGALSRRLTRRTTSGRDIRHFLTKDRGFNHFQNTASGGIRRPKMV